jgi:hypothetical protein
MSAAVLDKPVVQESVRLVGEAVEAKTPILAEAQAGAESNPLFIVFFACVIAFHLAAAMVGSIAAWIYCLRGSGSLSP